MIKVYLYIQKKQFLTLLFIIWVNFYYCQNFGWAKQIGGTTSDAGYSITRDASGDIITAGGFSGITDFDPGIGTNTLSSFSGSNDVFITKFDPSGNIIWAKQIGGGASDVANSITTDGVGNIYITGFFSGTCDFDPGPSTYNLSSSGVTSDIFVCKLDISGNFIWAIKMGGSTFDRGISIALDAIGNVYTTGYYSGILADFDPGVGTYTLSNSGGYDIFISKLDNSGNFIWAKQMSGTGNEQGNSIQIDALGNIYTSGIFTSANTDFDPGIGSYTLASAGLEDVFVSKLDASGNFIWVKQIGSSGSDICSSSKLDGSGNINITGNFNMNVDFDPNLASYFLFSFGGSDAFVTQLNPAGNPNWAIQLGGTGSDAAYSISVDNLGNCYTAGKFQNVGDFYPGIGTYTLFAIGSDDIFISKVNSSGNFQKALQIGGLNTNIATSINSDNTGNLYLTGYFTGSPDFDPGAATYTLTNPNTNSDIFICKLTNLNTGINESFGENQVKIFPNPNTGLFSIQLGNHSNNTQIEITNIVGQLILTSQLNEFDNTIEITDVEKGIYFLKVLVNNTFIETKKIIIE